MNADITPLTDIMARLRDRDTGCPWDIDQNFATIAPYTIEEAYEVADAIERNDLVSLKDELGDLLLQVVFHCQMASELGAFNLQDVVNGICDKMVRRHPHVYGDATATGHEVPDDWETIKAVERSGDEDGSALAGVALALPALLRAQKIQKRAARTGFDWPDRFGARDKILEELDEVNEATSAGHLAEEIGDLLFAVVNFARFHKVDAEYALKQASAKFERRFRDMELSAGNAFVGLSLDKKKNFGSKPKQKRKSKTLA